MSKSLGLVWAIVAVSAAMLLILASACTREIEVPGETVGVEKEVMIPGETVVVEKEVVKTVQVPGETVVVEKEVPVEVEVEKVVEVEKIVEVVKETEATKEEEMMAGPPIYQMGIFEEPISRNFWNYYGGPAGSVWTQYVLDGHSGSLYGYSDQRFDWVPSLAADFPTDLKMETVGDGEFWTAEVPLKTGVMWSDGHELDAGDFVFTVNTVSSVRRWSIGRFWIAWRRWTATN